MAENNEQNTNNDEFKELEQVKKVKPTFFGYRPPKWANDFNYVRENRGKGSPNDSETWVLYNVDRILKKFSK